MDQGKSSEFLQILWLTHLNRQAACIACRKYDIGPFIKILNTIRRETGCREAKCSKYFAQYGQQQLTGGILAAWCTHSIRYGFHCIPESEGYNNIFSAMITCWPVAPTIGVYDFACALGPYCMTREPRFFANTLFVIDHFHSTGHSKCSWACFLTTYTNVDPRLTKSIQVLQSVEMEGFIK